MDKMIKNIFTTLKKALQKVDNSYFKLPVSYCDLEIVRERVFCYELYHQIRKIQEENKYIVHFQLHAELDKKGHAFFKKKKRKIPDFLIHKSGNNDHNICIIEVKGVLNNKILKDLKSINIFLEYGYKFGILLIYNHSLNEFIDKILPKIKKCNKISEKIFICCVKNNKSEFEPQKLSTLLNK